MEELVKRKDDIIKVTFYLNLIVVILGIFLNIKWIFMTTIILNILFTFSYIMINKYSGLFDSRSNWFSGINKLSVSIIGGEK